MAHALLPKSVTLPVVIGTVAAFLVQTPIAIPLSRSAERLWPLTCAAAAPAAIWLLTVGDRWLELAAGRGRQVRLGLVVAVGLLALGAVGIGIGLAHALGQGRHDLHSAEVLRNFWLIVGTTVLAGRSPIREFAWAPAVGLVLGCWLIGSATPGSRPERWAVTLQPIGDRPAAITTLLVSVIGIGAYALRPPVGHVRPWKRPTAETIVTRSMTDAAR